MRKPRWTLHAKRLGGHPAAVSYHVQATPYLHRNVPYSTGKTNKPSKKDTTKSPTGPAKSDHKKETPQVPSLGPEGALPVNPLESRFLACPSPRETVAYGTRYILHTHESALRGDDDMQATAVRTAVGPLIIFLILYIPLLVTVGSAYITPCHCHGSSSKSRELVASTPWRLQPRKPRSPTPFQTLVAEGLAWPQDGQKFSADPTASPQLEQETQPAFSPPMGAGIKSAPGDGPTPLADLKPRASQESIERPPRSASEMLCIAAEERRVRRVRERESERRMKVDRKRG